MSTDVSLKCQQDDNYYIAFGRIRSQQLLDFNKIFVEIFCEF